MTFGASLVVHRIKTHLPTQGAHVQSLVQDDPMAMEHQASAPQLRKRLHPEPVLLNKQSHCDGKPALPNGDGKPALPNREQPHAPQRKPARATDPARPKVGK